MKFEKLPNELKEWLDEPEYFGFRLERLADDIAANNIELIYGWLNTAYSIGRKSSLTK